MMEPYMPSTENEEDPLRQDQEVWDLVGNDPAIINFRQMLRSYAGWARAEVETKTEIELRKILGMMERQTYDRLDQPYYRPSVEYHLFAGV